MAIQHRRGADVDFKPDRMKAGELALTTDGTRKMYAAFAPGDVKEVAFKEDIPEGGGGGSVEQVQADYAQTDSTQPDYIKNKLVGKEVTYSDTLTWDGNPEGKEAVVYIPSSGIGVYKMSDIVLSIEDFKNGCTVVFYSNGSEQTIECTASEIINDNGMLGIADYLVMVIPYDNFVDSEGTQYAKKGICFNSQSMSGHELYVKSFTIHGQNIFPTTTTKKLTAEYLEPFEVVTKGGDTLTWDGDTSGKYYVDAGEGLMFCHMSDNILTSADFVEGATAGNNINGIRSASASELDGLLFIQDGLGSAIYCIQTENYDIAGDGSIVLEKKGIYFMKDGEKFTTSLTINGYTGFPTTEKKLKEEYVIDTNSIILKSSGGKRFKVTVSDTGTLTATEI